MLSTRDMVVAITVTPPPNNSNTKAHSRMICCRNMIVRDQEEAPLTMTEATLFVPGLSPVSGKTITATFDDGTLSSNGGRPVSSPLTSRGPRRRPASTIQLLDRLRCGGLKRPSCAVYRRTTRRLSGGKLRRIGVRMRQAGGVSPRCNPSILSCFAPAPSRRSHALAARRGRIEILRDAPEPLNGLDIPVLFDHLVGADKQRSGPSLSGSMLRMLILC
jgi:hypothetical protein